MLFRMRRRERNRGVQCRVERTRILFRGDGGSVFFQPLSTMSTGCLPKWERKTTGGQEIEERQRQRLPAKCLPN